VTQDPRRGLPGVDRLLGMPEVELWTHRWGRGRVTNALRHIIAESRQEGGSAEVEEILARCEDRLVAADRPGLRRLINGTGVILHTNLGRAPLAAAATRAIDEIARGYTNLEFDVTTGARGDRYEHCRDLVAELVGSEDAIVVNNNAAAVVLVVNEFARGGEVIVSRGELVEIGGSFRIPEMIERAGARLVEVGTTNRTRIRDYRGALTSETGLILKVHPANYRIEGFAETTELDELVELGREAGVPVAWDLGSAMPSTHLPQALRGAPPSDSGADLVMWSGDKLLGGPQAGIVHGATERVARLRANPLLRTYRVDKLTLAALEATLRLWRDPDAAFEGIPSARMMTTPAADIRERAEASRERLPEELRDRVSVQGMESLVGAGSVPGVAIDSFGWAVEGNAAQIGEACRLDEPGLIGRVADDRFLVDFRCIMDTELEEVVGVVTRALRAHG
jgi:L-seryl-tRNA(Ser) seleniumtransferase